MNRVEEALGQVVQGDASTRRDTIRCALRERERWCVSMCSKTELAHKYQSARRGRVFLESARRQGEVRGGTKLRQPACFWERSLTSLVLLHM